MIRIVLCDDHPVVRAGFRALLENEPDLEVVAEAASGPEGVAVVAELRPDVVLMDLRMPGGDGVDATRAIGAGPSRTAVVIVTTYETDGDIVRAVEAGALGYLLKDTPAEELVRAVRAAARGETILSPSVAARLVRTVRQPHRAPLSPREKSVLRLVADGRTNGEIGLDLFITEATVKTHLLRIFTKLGVSDRTAAVTTAIDRGELT
ncbi:response regulator transcription factor [Lapillicoccus sp.]|uniref:response regulator n=1 Tax=Lapillicoccus sp. TaxID=1909287 RepID=UPI0025ECFB9C|nr:response regulator transcription factor [Lapillicoccus sp.]